MYSLLSKCRLETKDAADLEDLHKAGSYLLESFELGQKFPSGFQSIASTALDLAKAALSMAAPDFALEWTIKTLSGYKDLPPVYQETNRAHAAQCLLGLAQIVSSQDAAYSTRLLGCLETLQDEIPNIREEAFTGDFERTKEAALQQMEPDEVQKAWQAGGMMSLDEAVTYALDKFPNRPPAAA
jgi:hypothetical protein